MKLQVIQRGQQTALLVRAEQEKSELLIKTAQDAMDLLMTAKYEAESPIVIIDKTLITEEFFHLSTRLAGEILQKYVNYGGKLYIYGDFSEYKTVAWRSFVLECNRGKDFAFVETEEAAMARLEK